MKLPGMASPGEERQGRAGHGMAWVLRHKLVGISGHLRFQPWSGKAWHGEARKGKAWVLRHIIKTACLIRIQSRLLEV